MDEYSLHNIIIRKGKCLDETPEFISFKRTYLQRWASISYILMNLEKLLSMSDVEMAYIDGTKVADLSREDLELEKPSNEELFACVINSDEVGKSIRIPSLMFKGMEGPIKATTVIQKNWRMHKAKVAYTYLKYLMTKATTI
jgi:hypothetical protein